MNLTKLETKLLVEFESIFRLKDRINKIRKDYDVVILDTPPNLGLITVNALVSSQSVLIPIQASYFALSGTDDLLNTIEKLKVRSNPDLRIIGVLVTLVDKRTALAKDVELHIRNVFGKFTFTTTISKSVRLEESPANRQAIYSFAPRSKSSHEYRRLCTEVINRIR
jgi:chromosome partitioning protein